MDGENSRKRNKEDLKRKSDRYKRRKVSLYIERASWTVDKTFLTYLTSTANAGPTNEPTKVLTEKK